MPAGQLLPGGLQPFLPLGPPLDIMEEEDFPAGLGVAGDDFLQRAEPDTTINLRARRHHIGFGGPIKPPSRLDVLDGVVGDVAGSDFLAVSFAPDEEPGRHGGAVLDQFLGILSADAMGDPGNGRAEAGNDFVD